MASSDGQRYWFQQPVKQLSYSGLRKLYFQRRIFVRTPVKLPKHTPGIISYRVCMTFLISRAYHDLLPET